MLTLVETLTGLGTIALLISYLPGLYGAYSRREARLLTLDDPVGARMTPVRVIAVHSPDGSLELLYRFFAEWEIWTAEILESHVSYPMLALFRSQHAGSHGSPLKRKEAPGRASSNSEHRTAHDSSS